MTPVTHMSHIFEWRIMTSEQQVFEQALAFAAQKHKGQIRKGGEPFITHPITVCEMIREQGYGMDYQLTALFHDLLEDTDATEEEIEALGGQKVLKAVKLLTKEKGYQMPAYIAGIKSDPMALAVKTADRLHNVRSAGCTDEKFKRKYIQETETWYLDFSEDIRIALEELRKTL